MRVEELRAAAAGGSTPGPGAARWVPSSGAVIAVTLVAVVVAVVVVLRLLTAGAGGEVVAPGPSGTPVGAASTAGQDAASAPVLAAGSGGAAAGSPTVATATPTGLTVHVVGQVRRPGVVRLPLGARVGDAVRAAGGATRRADLAAVNLARPLVDGEQVRVPRPGEPAVAAPGPTTVPGSTGTAGTDGAGATGGRTGAAGGPVLDLNTATEADLDTLPGVGPVLAGRIVTWRQEHGRFTSVDDLAEVQGIGAATLERLRPLVLV